MAIPLITLLLCEKLHLSTTASTHNWLGQKQQLLMNVNSVTMNVSVRCGNVRRRSVASLSQLLSPATFHLLKLVATLSVAANWTSYSKLVCLNVMIVVVVVVVIEVSQSQADKCAMSLMRMICTRLIEVRTWVRTIMMSMTILTLTSLIKSSCVGTNRGCGVKLCYFK